MLVDDGEIPAAQGDGIDLPALAQLPFFRLQIHLRQEHPDVDNGQPQAHGQQHRGDEPGLGSTGEEGNEGEGAQDQREGRRLDPALSQPQHIEPGKPPEGFFIQPDGDDDFHFSCHL